MSKTKLKYCKNCNRIYQEKRTIKKRILKLTKYTFIIFVSITSLFGTTALYNFISGGIYENYDLLISIGGFYAFSTNFLSNFQSNELREIAINLTKNCSDDYAKAKKIYDHLLTFEYELGTNLNAYEVYKEGKFDCDEGSYLFLNLLKSISIKSQLQCNDNHCWLIIHLKNKNILADLVQGRWEDV